MSFIEWIKTEDLLKNYAKQIVDIHLDSPFRKQSKIKCTVCTHYLRNFSDVQHIVPKCDELSLTFIDLLHCKFLSFHPQVNCHFEAVMLLSVLLLMLLLVLSGFFVVVISGQPYTHRK